MTHTHLRHPYLLAKHLSHDHGILVPPAATRTALREAHDELHNEPEDLEGQEQK